jgi:hypothetical protein
MIVMFHPHWDFADGNGVEVVFAVGLTGGTPFSSNLAISEDPHLSRLQVDKFLVCSSEHD